MADFDKDTQTESVNPDESWRKTDPMENWLMKPALEWLEQAEHGDNNERCKMIAALLRDLWRGPCRGVASPNPPERL